ncbi:hypothetical protein [Sorangium sp. So ce1000]|uniref:hypothetical protein n=1 Tax=Sorangium sp. So ce1000 TaxID=3133325 RepID=UPI003F6372AB
MRATSRPAFEITSPSVAWRHEGLGRAFEVLALLAGGGPFLVSVIAVVLAGALDAPNLRRFALDTLFLTLLSSLLAFVLALVSALLDITPIARRGPARVAAGAAGLRVSFGAVERSIPRVEIRSGLVLSEPRVRVELHLRRGRVLEVQVAREEDGARLLAALGIGPTERRVAVSLGSVNRELVAGCVGLPAFMVLWLITVAPLSRPLSGGHPGPVVAWFALTLGSTWLLRRAARRTRIVVGTDGVRVDRAFSTVWLPYAELDSVRTLGGRLLLSRRGGRGSVVLRTGDNLTEALARRIREAHEGAAVGAAPRGADVLERRGRELAVWREDLRKLLAGGDYRAAGVTPEDALRTLGDADAPRDRRVGAALLLRIACHPEAQERIRVAAGATADDALSAALERAAEDEVDEAALARALR